MLVLDSWLKKLKDRFNKKEPEGENIPENWVPELLQKQTTEIQEDGTVKVIYEEKKDKRYIARRIKRFVTMILILANFIMLVTCFFVQGGIMAPFFGGNVVFLSDYFWKTRPMTEDRYKNLENHR